MQNEIRDRLIESIDDYISTVEVKDWYSEELDEGLADHLLADGWIRPPYKVGDMVWFLHKGSELCEARIIYMEENYYTFPQTWMTVEFFSKIIGTNTYKSRIDLMLGKTVFLTKEEAERALKERENNGC